jgi:DNA-binding MarR family transcriptional regulator
MEQLLIEFINTLDLSLKKLNREAGESSGFSRLTISQLQYIDAISALEAPTITEIAARLKISKASATTGVNKLIQLGYATKIRSSQDRRVYHVSLTTAGEQLIRAKHQAVKAYGDFILGALTEDEARQFEATLTKLVQLFEQA